MEREFYVGCERNEWHRIMIGGILHSRFLPTKISSLISQSINQSIKLVVCHLLITQLSSQYLANESANQTDVRVPFITFQLNIHPSSGFFFNGMCLHKTTTNYLDSSNFYCTAIYTCIYYYIHLFLKWSVMRQVHRHFQSEFSTHWDAVFPLSVSRILSFPQGHPVPARFLVFPITPVLPSIFPSVMRFRKQFLRKK